MGRPRRLRESERGPEGEDVAPMRHVGAVLFGDTADGVWYLDLIRSGGGFGAAGAIGREILRDVKAEDAPARVEGLLKAYLSHRTAAGESFQDFSARHEVAVLKSFAEGQDA